MLANCADEESSQHRRTVENIWGALGWGTGSKLFVRGALAEVVHSGQATAEQPLSYGGNSKIPARIGRDFEISPLKASNLPQVAEINTPQAVDVTEMSLSYDEHRPQIENFGTSPHNLRAITLIEKDKRLFKKFNQKFNDYKTIFMKQSQYSGEEILEKLDIQPGSPVIVFMGGTAKMKPEDGSRLAHAIHDGVARAAVELGASVVDGGTNSGTLGLLNTALRERKHPGIYLGVAPEALTHLPDHPTNGTLETLGDAHTHFVLVEGENWGDELIPMYALINALAEGVPSVAVLVNGGKGAQDEVGENVRDDRKVVVLAGSGRLADKISLQLRYPGTLGDANVAKMSKDGDFTIFDIQLDPDQLAKKIKDYLKA